MTAWDTVKIDNNLDVVFPCPSDGLAKVVVLPRDERFARTDFVGPITDRNAHVIESKNKYQHVRLVGDLK